MVKFLKKHKFLKSIVVVILVIFLKVLIYIKKVNKTLGKVSIKVKALIILICLIIIVSFLVVIKKNYYIYYDKALLYNVDVTDSGSLKGPIDYFILKNSVIDKEEQMFEDTKNIVKILNILGERNLSVSDKFNLNEYNIYTNKLKDKVDILNIFLNNLSDFLNKSPNNHLEEIKKIEEIGILTPNNLEDKVPEILETLKILKESLNSSDVEGILKKLLKDKDISYYYYDPLDDESLKYKENIMYVDDSYKKIAVSTMIIDMVNDNKIKLDDLEYYNKVDQDLGKGIIKEDKFYTQYSIKYLLEAMLKYSDNVATNILVRVSKDTMGDEYYTDYINNIAGKENISNGKINSEGAMNIIKNLYIKSDAKKYYYDIIDMLESNKEKKMISSKLEEVRVAHMPSNTGKSFNDIGIIDLETPFLLTVYCSEEYDACNEIIGEISNLFYYYQIIKHF